MEFTWPAGMAMAQDSRLFVTDEWEHHVAIFPSDVLYPYPEFNPDGERIGQWGEAGSEPGQLNAPSGIEVDGGRQRVRRRHRQRPGAEVHEGRRVHPRLG